MKLWRTIRTVIVAMMMIFTFTSCEVVINFIDDVTGSLKPDKENPYFSTTNDISIYNEDVTQYILEVCDDGLTIIYDASTPNDALPKVGALIYIPVSESTPYGVLARVISIQRDDVIYVEVEPLALDEAFEYLSVDESTPIVPELEGVFDDEGNPIEYEIVDADQINFDDSSVATPQTLEVKSFEFDEDCIKIPFNLHKVQSGKNKIEASGTLFMGFHNFNFDIDISKGLKYVNLDVTPYVKLAMSSAVATESKLELSDRIGQLRLKVTIPTPVGIPLIVPITTYIYGTCGIKGELSATLGLQYEYNCHCVVTYKNGNWSSSATHGGCDGNSPWSVGEFDVKGEIYSGSKIGMLVGLYSATSGVGFNIEPRYSLATQAQLSSEDLLKTNPNVELAVKTSGDVYCVASLFGKELAKYTIQLPDYTLWSQTTYLFPNITDFSAVGSSSSADISWHHDSFYFLSKADINTGTTVFESDGVTEVESYMPSPSSITNEIYSYHVNATDLNAGGTYYAAPFVSWGNYRWYGEMEEFTTEASYHAGFRCSNHNYDNIYFDFTISKESSNTFDFTEEFSDYDGDLERIHFTATYDKETNILSGVIDYHFYDDPDQRRQDGFSVSLDSDDSGYIYCEKVIANGGCDKMVRIYKNGTTAARSMSYNYPIISSDCHVGDCL